MWKCSFRSFVMIPTLAGWCLRKKQLGDLARLSRRISVRKSLSEISHQYAHITERQSALWSDRAASEISPPDPQKSLRLHRTCVYYYESHSSKWVPLQREEDTALERDCVVTIISWNIDVHKPGPKPRAVAILSHLEGSCGEVPTRTAIMLQEVCQDSLSAILESSWVQRFFKISNVAPPESL